MTTTLQPARLTAKRLTILRLAANGHTNQQIARRTGVALETVKTQMCITLRQLGAEDRTHAVMIAVVHGWIQLSEIRIPAPSPSRPVGRPRKDVAA